MVLKILVFIDELLNRVRKERDGFSAKIHSELIRDMPCYLNDQLFRNSNVSKELLGGVELIGYSRGVIAGAGNFVDGWYVLTECWNRKNLIWFFYQQKLFKEIAQIPNGNVPMVQRIQKIE